VYTPIVQYGEYIPYTVTVADAVPVIIPVPVLVESSFVRRIYRRLIEPALD
jgi:hypothetical protein